MKALHHFTTALTCALFAVQTLAATDVVADWNAELDAAQQASRQNVGGRVRADAILHAVLVETMTGIEADRQSGRPAEPVPAGVSLEAAAAQAVYSVVAMLYPQSRLALDVRLTNSLARISDAAPAIAAGRKWGEHVAQVVLAEQSDAVALNAFSFAEDAQPPAAPAPVPVLRAEPRAVQAAIGPGRYRFNVLAGVPGTKGYVDGSGAVVRFDSPGGVAVDAAGNVYVSEQNMGTIRKIAPDGVAATWAGTAGQKGSEDGTGSSARFNQPSGLAVDGAGNVYVADRGNHTIRKINSSGNVTTLAGTAGAPGATDGTKEMARLNAPTFVAVDEAGNVFATGVGPIRKVTADGTVSTLLVPVNDSYYGTPRQITVDRTGNLYVIDSNLWDYSNVVKLTSTVPGEYQSAGQIVPPYYDSNSIWATGIGLDENGSLFFRSLNEPVWVRAPGGELKARHEAEISDVDWFEHVAVGKSGELYIVRNDLSDNSAQIGAVKIGVFDPAAQGPVILRQPYDQQRYAGEDAAFLVTAVGAPTWTYQWYFNSNPINGATSYSLELKNVQAGDAGLYSVVVTDGAGSVTSRKVKLVVKESPTPGTGTGNTTNSPGGGTGSSTNSPGPGSAAAGGGSFDPGISLAVLGLLAAAAGRRQRTAPAASADRGPA
jgi:hypothetical protein